MDELELKLKIQDMIEESKDWIDGVSGFTWKVDDEKLAINLVNFIKTLK